MARRTARRTTPRKGRQTARRGRTGARRTDTRRGRTAARRTDTRRGRTGPRRTDTRRGRTAVRKEATSTRRRASGRTARRSSVRKAATKRKEPVPSDKSALDSFLAGIDTKESNEYYQKMSEKWSQLGVYSVGRYGGWKYCSIEDNIIEAKQLAEKIAKS